jgi:hypothetical protein
MTAAADRRQKAIDRRAASKARRKQHIRHYGAFARDDLIAGMLEALGFLRTIEPQHADVEAAWQTFTDELLSSYERESDMSQLALPKRAMFGEPDFITED